MHISDTFIYINITIQEVDVKKKVKILKALADDTRLKIVLCLLNGRKSVTEITQIVQKAQPTVSIQLRVLELSGLIESEKESRFVYYKIADKNIFAVLGEQNKVKILKALADETRLKIILRLLAGRESVTKITQHVQKAQPTVSLQLRVLELSGLIESEKEGRFTFYSITDKSVLQVVNALEGKKS